ncbi:trichothecene biosynthesis transcription regulator TRI6 [Colletotrichum spaethianum]|uniref:Trichothecene biosynthesis transcription regulator TRI6 n=1 Tax=Colletotrichum spaethianum TaxID=700344 RepID=A0AA37L6V5_9PEZI|nr:trichothecene biosynthesis transcription regulator TRI6 [Colletotrichum spaethianum]GKT42886.1 trichothecene biosynthesis transcription regulator TRI6 [Colletotrichum spaethianum]
MDEPIEILGQLPNLNIYTQIAICFSATEEHSTSKIINTLTNGLERLAATFPWIAGQVVNEGASADNTGVFKIKQHEAAPPLVIKDLRDDVSAPTMHAMKQANFPFSMLDESIVAARPTLPIDPTLAGTPNPVFIVQATFIKGGLILTFLGQHQTMDGIGQGQIIDLLSKACQNESFTDEEIATGNLPRHNIVPLLDNYQRGPEIDTMIVTPPVRPPAAPAKCSWAYFDFAASSLSTLKSAASETVKSGYITTDDTLTAFVWQAVSRVRASRLTPEEEIKIARAVNVRGYLGVPQTFPGMIQIMTYNSSPLKDLVDGPLGKAASQLRSTVNPEALNYATRAFATVLDQSPDKRNLSLIGTFSLDRDIMLSSWAKLDLYEQDFGLGLGQPESVRRPQFTPVEGLLYLMPKSREGSIALAICLRDEDMARLKEDEEWLKYSTYIG